MKKDKLNSFNSKYFFIPLAVILVVFVGLMFYMISRQITENAREYEEDALKIAKSYSHTLEQSYEAHTTVADLLNKQIILASRAILLVEDINNNDTLTDFAQTFGLDEIHLYDSSGEIINSKNNKYVGWKAYSGHPVHDFMISGEDMLVEDIRKDSESENYYQYAYLRKNDGSFIQIGILAENIQDFLGNFEIQRMLDDMADLHDLFFVAFINPEFNVVASNKQEFIGMNIEKEHSSLVGSRTYTTAKTSIDNIRAYSVCIPIYYNSDQLGVLSVAWPSADQESEIRSIIINGFIQLLIIIVFFGSILYYAYRKNKMNVKIAFYDQTTGLPNVEYLYEYLQETVQKAKNTEIALLLLHFANFKLLNQTYGYTYSDAAIRQIAVRLQEFVSEEEMLFRFSSERIALVKGSYNNRYNLGKFAQSIKSALDNPLDIDGEQQYINAEIGIVEVLDSDVSANELLQDATLALSHISTNSNGAICFYESFMAEASKRRDKVEKAVRSIIKGDTKNGFKLNFQPKKNLKTSGLEGFEALARLHVEGLGDVPPPEFIDIAEKNFLIYDLGKIVLQKACEFVRHINNQGLVGLSVAVNISGSQLMRDEFIDDVLAIIAAGEIELQQIEFEITESILLDNFGLVNDKLKKIRQLGIKVSIDDFGTGFSSLSRLKELNIDFVKIDKFFIDRISVETETNLITADIISMAHKIGLKVVAEGVEDIKQLAYLEKYNCDLIQGYILSKPLPADEAIEFLNKQGDTNID